ncbi:MAG TPA: hypothetical protein VH914_21800 [Acidimicrobiia bacterium]|nr:hypothetical protein [Acidimicrobiia bacterium]
MRGTRSFLVGAVALCVTLVPIGVGAHAAVAVAPPVAPTRISVSTTGGDPNGKSSAPAISDKGRYVAFSSAATNLVAAGASDVTNVFVRDLVANTTQLVSVSTSGVAGNQRSDQPSISGDGRYIAFRSSATNLVDGDTNHVADIFVRDLVAQTTTRVSVATGGDQTNGASSDPHIGVKGRFVAFTSSATTLGAPPQVTGDAYIHSMKAGTTTVAGLRTGDDDCRDSGSVQNRSAVALSGDASHVAILVFCDGSLYLYDRTRHTGVTHLVGGTYTGSGVAGTITSVRYSPDGATMGWITTTEHDGNAIHLLDTFAGTSETIDPPATGVYPDGLGLSENGRIVYVGGNGIGRKPAIVGPPVGVPKVYSYDRADGTIRYVSVPLEGASATATGTCTAPALVADANTAVFTCTADDIVPDDHDGTADIFVNAVASSPAPDLQAITTMPNVTVSEPTSGSTDATVTVDLDRPARFDGQIRVSFRDVTASSPADYDSTTQYIAIRRGDTSGSVQVPIHANGLESGSRTFRVITHVDFGDLRRGAHSNALVTITA